MTEVSQDFYRRDLIELAERIIDAKSNADDEKASCDMMVIRKILNHEDNGIFNPVAVDERLRREYSSIEQLENLASMFPINTYESGKNYDELTLRLYADARGICADVLMKHGRMTALRELIRA